MASNLLSRFLSANSVASRSVYEAIEQDDRDAEEMDLEARAGMSVDEENLGAHFNEYELDAALADASETQSGTQGSHFLQQLSPKSPVAFSRKSNPQNQRWGQTSPRATEPDEGDDDVPASLLIEGGRDEDAPPPPPPPPNHITLEDQAIPGPSTREARHHWDTTRSHQPIHSVPPRIFPLSDAPRRRRNGLPVVDPKEEAMWRWANVENLDNFLKDVYVYFLGNGIWSIVLNRVLNLLTLAFVVGFTTFLSSCIDYRKVSHSKTMSEIVVPRCMSKMSATATFLLWLFTLFWIGKLFQYIMDFRRLRHIHDFYYYLLGVSDTDIQTISWQEVVSRLMTLRDSNPAITGGAKAAKLRRFIGSQSKQRLDAHDIANRLMRKENYLIALFNKGILDLTLPLPFLKNRQLFSRTLEWNLNLCLLDFVFNDQGQVRTLFLKDTHRKQLSEGLRRRFILAGILSIFAAPFIAAYFLMHHFFRYFNEYHKNPSQIGSRQYTPLAEWKFREFNELWHLFQRRVNMSYPFANRYVDQFPKDKTVQISRFIAFITGALASVLALTTLVDHELFLGFEITPGRTVLFYLGVFGTVWAVARGVVPEETLVFDPEYALREVIGFTHYQPTHWQGRLHSDDVRKEFAALYQMKLIIFMEEILSMIFTPFILWFCLPNCSDRLIDFFREFTVHVDGLGYVCSFAVFDFKKGTNIMTQAQTQNQGAGQQDLRDDYFSTKDGKMLASYYGFLDNYAGNPRTGGQYNSNAANRRYFHPPPSFPPLESPALATGMRSPTLHPPGKWDQNQQPTVNRPFTAGGQHSLRARTPKFGAADPGGAVHNSPLPSMLLDPHHQPSASGFRSLNRPLAQSRYRPHRAPHNLGDTILDEDEIPSPPAGLVEQPSNATTASSAAAATDDGHMEESWRMSLAADVDDDEEVEQVKDVVGGPGVLGLIHQFQKVGNEGLGGGVGAGI
ncbi:hypothetical protein AJ80_01696 [Polytolypa hystricis UAMH7299]|uniref:Autophagy-related protein 9 n=1 Tax=Polytolypa hystricis (strain UAMH7299) TaxID=1447883 RepID=A0A2B7Z163_POLH7|nr:hypothetical protein AJ80_01696 [Polytolypa hystricis UAMH7299]